MLDRLLEKAQCQPTEELALRIWEASHSPLNARRLFQTASSIRNARLGNRFSWFASIDGNALRDKRPNSSDGTDTPINRVRESELHRAIQTLKHKGFTRLRLDLTASGSGCDWESVSMAETLKATSEFSLEISVRTPPRRQTVRRLKDLGIRRLLCDSGITGGDSNPAPSADSAMERMKSLIEACEETGLPVASRLSMGLSERCESRLRRLFLLAQFKSSLCIQFSNALPPVTDRGTNHLRCSAGELARSIALARLILPEAQICLEECSHTSNLPLWIHAGGGNQLIGASIVQQEAGALSDQASFLVIDNMEKQRRQVESMGLEIGFHLSPPINRGNTPETLLRLPQALAFEDIFYRDSLRMLRTVFRMD